MDSEKPANAGDGPGAADKTDVPTAPFMPKDPIDLKAAKTAKLAEPKITPISEVGYDLAKRFTWILTLYLFVAVVTIVWLELSYLRKVDVITTELVTASAQQASATLQAGGTQQPRTNWPSKETLEGTLKPISDAYKEARSDLIEFHRTVIVNVLLPILTALLGYLFGNREKKQDDK